MGRGGFRPAPRARAPVPAIPAAAPAPATQSSGGVMGAGVSFVSYVVAGLTLGAGLILGHRVVEFFAGPRTIQVVQAPSPSGSPAADACGIHNQAFADCINHNGSSDISRCKPYLDMLNQCRRRGSHGIAAAVSIA